MSQIFLGGKILNRAICIFVGGVGMGKQKFVRVELNAENKT